MWAQNGNAFKDLSQLIPFERWLYFPLWWGILGPSQSILNFPCVWFFRFHRIVEDWPKEKLEHLETGTRYGKKWDSGWQAQLVQQVHWLTHRAGWDGLTQWREAFSYLLNFIHGCSWVPLSFSQEPWGLLLLNILAPVSGWLQLSCSVTQHYPFLNHFEDWPENARQFQDPGFFGPPEEQRMGKCSKHQPLPFWVWVLWW